MKKLNIKKKNEVKLKYDEELNNIKENNKKLFSEDLSKLKESYLEKKEEEDEKDEEKKNLMKKKNIQKK